MPFPLFELDERGHVLSANAAARRELGPPVRHSLVSCLGGATNQEVMVRLDRLLREGAAPPWSSELMPALYAGEPLPAHLSLSVIPAPYGDPWRAMLSVVPVPVQAAGNTARPITQELPRVHDRRAAVRTLAAGVAHEIGNPLTYMFMCLDELTRELEQAGDTDRFEPLLHKTRQGAERVREIVRGLSSFGRDHGRRELVDVNRAVRSALEMARSALREHIRVNTTLEKIPMVRANPSRLVQVLYNLIVNAAHALPNDDPNAALGVDSWQEGSWVYINVWDTGPGIEPSIRDHIFEPFVSSKPAGQGAGLGLAVCHNYVAELGGEIDFDCEPEQGTRFTVRLPAEDREPQVIHVASEPPEPARAHLLVIDDEPEIRRGLKMMLQRFGHVDVAESAAAARALLDSDTPYDLVLCDLMMPGESGEELYGWITSVRPDLASRVAYVTGGGPRLGNARSEVTAEDGPPCLLKPFRRKELYEFVREAMARGASIPTDTALD
ncbi:MAG: hybrid sensor histidine kinase/response regulator [Myxococcales bacterium]|nr:hybrid sensor histidine kinase/response regulator [Myxococcales bacterium]